jgi:hypothetical protein
MRPRGVVVGDPGGDEPARLIEIDEQVLVEKLVAQAAVHAGHIGELHRSYTTSKDTTPQRNFRPTSCALIRRVRLPQETSRLPARSLLGDPIPFDVRCLLHSGNTPLDISQALTNTEDDSDRLATSL